MFLKLGHTKLDVYTTSRQLVKESHKVVAYFPTEEKYVLSQQIKRAALSVQLNIAEGSSRRSDIERRRYYEIARGSVIEIDAALDAAEELGYFTCESVPEFGEIVVKCFKYLSGLINSIPIQ